MNRYIKITAVILISALIILVVLPYSIALVWEHLPNSGHKNDNASPNFTLAEVPDSIDVYITEKDAVETVKFEEYVKGVVASEMPSEFNIEALKAQSVAARTYSLAKQQKAQSSGNPKSHSSAPLCDTTHCQVYRDAATLKSLKGDKWMETSWPKICEAVDATKGQLLYYNGELVQQALFHSSSGGKTENCEDVFASAVPYLVSVDSPYEDAATHQNEETTFTLSQFSSKIKAANPRIDFGSITSSNIKIVSRSSGGRVENMSIGKGVLTGRSVREALGLSSANFTISITKDNITFTSNGSGHGVGMSQYGANGMAEEGYDYKEILAHYYTGTEVY